MSASAKGHRSRRLSTARRTPREDAPAMLHNACVDALERRTLMSASLAGGVLTANGTAGNDDLRIDLRDGQLAVTLNGLSQGTFGPAGVTSIVLDGLDGDDQLRVGANILGARLVGGNGNDLLIGGQRNDTLDGGAGNDVLDGKEGADVYVGGLGFDNADYRFESADLVLSLDGVANEQGGNAQGDNLGADVERIISGSGSDRITGSNADNSITARDGDDTVFGLGGNDSIDGDAGNDSIDGGLGNDVLTGHGGADTMLGADGTDSFIANDGVRDVLRGGAGADQAFADPIDDAAEIEGGVTLPGPEVTVTQGTTGINDGSSTVAFGAVTQGAAAPTRVFTVRNEGNAALTLGAVQAPAGFTVVEGLSSSLAPGASDTFTLRLDTAAAGARTGQVTIANNDANENPFNFTVTGTVNAVVLPPPTAPKYPEVAVTLNGANVADNSTAAVQFGTVTRGAGAPTRTFTVRNAGAANLTLGAVSLPAGFSLVEGLTGTLAPGASDTFTVGLNTDVAGTRTGQITFATNDGDENPFNFAVAGTVNNPVTPPPPAPKYPEVTVSLGTANVADNSTAAINFGTVTRGAGAPARTFTVKNTGQATLTLGAVRLPAGFALAEGLATSLAPGASDTFTVRLDTSVAGYKAGQVNFTTNDGDENPFNFTVSGQVNNPPPPPPAPKYPEVTVSLVQGTTSINVNDNATAPISFGTATRGQAAPTRTFRVKNDGLANLTLGAIALPVGYGVAEGLVSTLAPGASDTFTIRLDTLTAGAKSGQVSFANNDANENPFNFAVGGTVNNPPPPPAPKYPEVAVTLNGGNVADNSTAAINFGTVTRGAGAPTRTFTVRNAGQATLNLSGLRVPAGYAVTEGLTSSLAPGASDTFTVRLDTAVAGVKSGQITFATNDGDENPFNFSITGTVNNPPPPPAPKYPEVTVTMASNGMNVADGSTAAINFGAVTRGQGGPTRTFRVKNDGLATLNLGAVTVPAGFKLIDPLVGPLAPGAMESFTVQVDTAVAGTKSGQVSIANNDANEGPFNFAIVATVNNPAPTTPTPPPAPKVTAVMAADGTLTVTGTPGNDSIVMTYDGAGIRVTSNGNVVGGSPFQRVKKIAVNSGEGNDLIYLTDLNVPAVLNGGGGSDTLRAGSGNDSANGNAGPDVVEGYVGNDTLLGGPGDDLIIGGPGLDDLYGQDGNDTVQATDGLGDRMVDGGNGTDTIRKDRTDTASGT